MDDVERHNGSRKGGVESGVWIEGRATKAPGTVALPGSLRAILCGAKRQLHAKCIQASGGQITGALKKMDHGTRQQARMQAM